MKTLYLLLLWLAAVRPPPRAVAVNSTATFNEAYKPKNYILLNCGVSGSANDTIGRVWLGDVNSNYTPSQTSESLTAADQSSAPRVPYLTARVFTDPLTYSFNVGPGRKFVRLHFYPNNYSSYSAVDALFSVASVSSSTLLDNFSAFDTALSLNSAYFVREFSINVPDNGYDDLYLTFTPSVSHSGAYAFVNGIEVVSTPDFFNTSSVFVNGGNIQTYSVEPNSAIQTLYRLNVGGNAISPNQDSGLDRSWADDSPYLRGADYGRIFSAESGISIQYSPSVPMYIAPRNVYLTARSMGPNTNMNLKSNLSWIFPVDAGFYYLLRFHFCEIQHEINDTNVRVFNIYIENLTAVEGADVFAWSKGIGKPVYEDYVTSIPGNGFADLFVDLHPYIEYKPVYYDAILNGLEIFKLQNSDGSLAGLNPPLPLTPDAGSTKNSNKVREKHKSKQLLEIAGGSIGGIAFLLLVGVLLFVICRIGKKKKKKTKKGNDTGTSNGRSSWLPITLSRSSASRKTHTTRSSHASTLPSDLCRHFFFSEIESATENFDEARILGIDGFGKVYRGDIDGGTSNVAIKRGNPLSEQGIHEFLTEIELLSKLRHRHLVSLIGYCEENHEMVLVYDYMARGTLREHLYRTDNPPIPWRQRLEICIGAARGIHYLHTGAKYTVIHRDVKTTNILLDENWVTKVSDFGLSKAALMHDQSHVSTAVKGSFGYLDPEYFRLGQLTEKSDVYSFGVVLFEVLCARPALNPMLPKEEVSLADWAVKCRKKGVLDQIIDPYLKGSVDAQCFKKFAEIAEKCLADQGIERPAMGDVMLSLELALQLQVSSEEREGVMGSSNGDASPLKREIEDLSKYSGTSEISTTTSIGGRSITSDESERLTPSAVFSQIRNANGR